MWKNLIFFIKKQRWGSGGQIWLQSEPFQSPQLLCGHLLPKQEGPMWVLQCTHISGQHPRRRPVVLPNLWKGQDSFCSRCWPSAPSTLSLSDAGCCGPCLCSLLVLFWLTLLRSHPSPFPVFTHSHFLSPLPSRAGLTIQAGEPGSSLDKPRCCPCCPEAVMVQRGPAGAHGRQGARQKEQCEGGQEECGKWMPAAEGCGEG